MINRTLIKIIVLGWVLLQISPAAFAWKKKVLPTIEITDKVRQSLLSHIHMQYGDRVETTNYGTIHGFRSDKIEGIEVRVTYNHSQLSSYFIKKLTLNCLSSKPQSIDDWRCEEDDSYVYDKDGLQTNVSNFGYLGEEEALRIMGIINELKWIDKGSCSSLPRNVSYIRLNNWEHNRFVVSLFGDTNQTMNGRWMHTFISIKKDATSNKLYVAEIRYRELPRSENRISLKAASDINAFELGPLCKST